MGLMHKIASLSTADRIALAGVAIALVLGVASLWVARHYGHKGERRAAADESKKAAQMSRRAHLFLRMTAPDPAVPGELTVSIANTGNRAAGGIQWSIAIPERAGDGINAEVVAGSLLDDERTVSIGGGLYRRLRGELKTVVLPNSEVPCAKMVMSPKVIEEYRRLEVRSVDFSWTLQFEDAEPVSGSDQFLLIAC